MRAGVGSRGAPGLASSELAKSVHDTGLADSDACRLCESGVSEFPVMQFHRPCVSVSAITFEGVVQSGLNLVCECKMVIPWTSSLTRKIP